MVEIITIGVAVAKSVFQVHGVDGSGAVGVRRQLRRGEVLKSSAGCRRALSAWKPAVARITGLARSAPWGTRFGFCRRLM